MTRAALSLSFLAVGAVLSVDAQTWNLTTGGSWATAGNWSPQTVPNAVGAVAAFAATNGGNRSITIDSGAGGFTVGAISFDLTGTFTNSLTAGAAGSNLKLDNGGAGVTISTTGDGTGNNTIVVPLVFNDTVTAVVNQTTSGSAQGSLNLTAAITGTGGFIKQGDGLVTFGTGAKTYTGATVLSGGRMRTSVAAAPTATSSFTVKAGAQLALITAGTYTFGTGPLNLNGNGAASGRYAAFPGAVRNDADRVFVIANAVTLQTDSSVVATGTSAEITFTGVVSGPGRFTVGSGEAGATGFVALNGANTYAGGTVVEGGTLVVGLTGGGSASTASLGTGDVTVTGVAGPSSLQIQAGVTNAIADGATLSLSGGGTAGVADVGFASLAAGVNEIVGALVLGGVSQPDGTYGATGSGAGNIFDEYFAGNGIITVLTPVPEPSGVLLAAGAAAGAAFLAGRRRASR